MKSKEKKENAPWPKPRKGANLMYEIIDQETGRRIGRPVKTSRAASRMITILQRKTGKYPDYRKIPKSLCPELSTINLE